MRTAKISEYRSRLSSYHKSVLNDHEPLRIVGGSRGDLMVIPANDYEILQETISILKDRATMNSLLENRGDYFSKSVEGQELGDAFSDVLEGKNK